MTSRLILVLAVAALTAGCATLNPEQRQAQCEATDWQRFGLNDGRLGVPTSDRSETFSDCADLGRPVDLAVYQAGRTEGLQSYCTVETGYQVGLEGRRYQNVCPPSLEPDFLQGYQRGQAERPSVTISPSIGIGIGSGGGVGVGVGIGFFNSFLGYRVGYPYGYRYKPRRYSRISRCRWWVQYRRLHC
ncbi:MAG: DUF2799 domain-containing protein [Pseudomonadota bacterium]